MVRLSPAVLLCVAAATAADPIDGTVLPLPAPGGWALLADGVTLVVSQPEKGELVYFDTVAEKEAKRVAVDFKPGALAVQGDVLYVAAKGASAVHSFDGKTGKPRKEIDLGGEAVANLACHPAKGMVYASTATYQVYAIDPASEKAKKTKAVGHFLAVDPVDAAALYTGVQPPLNDREVVIEDLPGGGIKIYRDTWGARAFILKYAVEGKGLKLASSQPNAACNAYSLAVTPDGKKVMMTSGGGWRPPVQGGTGGGYMSAAFSTEKLESRAGEAPAGTNMAFHPVLNLGVLNQAGRDLQFFNPKSLVAGKQVSVARGADARPLLVTFAAKGTKVVLWNGDNPANPREGLHFLPFELSAADRAALEKAHGKLPAAPAPAVPPGSGTSPGSAVSPKPAAPATAGDAPLPAGVIAEAGFNDAKGINADEAADAPYPLGKSNVRGGVGERGWKEPWPATDKATYVTDVVAEGDGAVFLKPTVNFARTWSKPQDGTFHVEMKVRCPAGGGMQCYVKEDRHESTGPMWAVGDGWFRAMNGNGHGNGQWADLAGCKADTWYAVRMTIDVAKQSWKMSVDGKPVGGEYRFRFAPKALAKVDFLVEGKQSIYLDAVRILERRRSDPGPLD